MERRKEEPHSHPNQPLMSGSVSYIASRGVPMRAPGSVTFRYYDSLIHDHVSRVCVHQVRKVIKEKKSAVRSSPLAPLRS
jgi:hypothetical protein